MNNLLEKIKKVFTNFSHKKDVDESKVGLDIVFMWKMSRIFFVCAICAFIGFGVWLFLSLYKDPQLLPDNKVKTTTFNQKQYQDVITYIKDRGKKFDDLQTPPSVLDPSL